MRKSSSADKTLEAALRALRRALSASKARWMVIGGVAVIAHGVQRMTTDLDAVIEGGAIELRQLLRQLQEAAIVPRIAAAVAFAEANLVLLVRHLPSEVDLDLSLAWTSFERDALAERELIAFGNVKAPMATVETLLVFKAIAGRSRDRDDTLALLNLYPKLDLAKVRSRVVELAGLADAPELVREFDGLVAQAKARHAASRPKQPARRRSAGKQVHDASASRKARTKSAGSVASAKETKRSVVRKSRTRSPRTNRPKR